PAGLWEGWARLCSTSASANVRWRLQWFSQKQALRRDCKFPADRGTESEIDPAVAFPSHGFGDQPQGLPSMHYARCYEPVERRRAPFARPSNLGSRARIPHEFRETHRPLIG